MTATQKKVGYEVTPEVAVLRVGDILKVIRFETVKKWAAQTIKKQRRGVYTNGGESVELFADAYDSNVLLGFNDFARWSARYWAESQMGKIADLYYRQAGEPMDSETRLEVIDNIKAIAAQEIEAAKVELDKE